MLCADDLMTKGKHDSDDISINIYQHNTNDNERVRFGYYGTVQDALLLRLLQVIEIDNTVYSFNLWCMMHIHFFFGFLSCLFLLIFYPILFLFTDYLFFLTF